MSRDFKYKDFANKLRFQVGGVCPDDFNEYGEKYIKSVVSSKTLKVAEMLYKEPSINAEGCEVITQIIAEWTFHKIIDLMKGEIPESFHNIVIDRVNKAIYDHLKSLNEVSEITYDTVENDYNDFIGKVEKIVKNAYRDELAKIYSDRGIDKDTYTWALEQSHIDEQTDEASEETEVKTDTCEFSSTQDSFTLWELFETNIALFIMYPISIVVWISIVVLSATKHQLVAVFISILAVVFFTFRFCYIIMDGVWTIAVKRLQEIRESYKSLKEEYEASAPSLMYQNLGVDMLSFQIGSKLVDFCDPEIDNSMMTMIGELRKDLTDDLGYVIPSVRIMDNLKFEPYECRIFVRGICRDTFFIDKKCDRKEFVSIVREHLHDSCIKYANDIITKSEVLKLMELVRTQDPTLVNDLVPELISAIDLRRILVNLVREQISIKDVTLLFERLCDFARYNKESHVLSERLRAEMGGQICESYSVKKDGEDVIYAFTFSEDFEALLEQAVCSTELGTMLKLTPEQLQTLLKAISDTFEANPEHREDAVIIVSPRIRRALFGFLSKGFPFIRIMSFAELVDEVRVEKLGEIDL